MNNIKIIKGDITALDVDVIVNAANNELLGGGGVDGLIHERAGKELDLACAKLGGCKTGEAKITKGFNLKAPYIIHTVAPKWFDESVKDKELLLKNAYRNSYQLAKEYHLRSIAFPCLGAGVYGVPLDVSARIAIDEALEQSPFFEVIYLVCFKEEEYREYLRYYQSIIKL